MAILVIQDQADAREKVAFSIESTFGGEVYQATTPGEAIKILRIRPAPR